MIDRRAILGLSGLAGCAAAVGWLSWPRRAFGFGPVSLGQTKDAALTALGPGFFAQDLCSGMLGVLYNVRDPGFATSDGDAMPVMAMFGTVGDRVTEISASLSWPNGGMPIESWHTLVTAQETEIGRRIGTTGRAAGSLNDDLAAETSREFKTGDATVTLRSRWMRRSGAAFSHIHLLAAGETRVIA
jgi:hypothetical protein